MRSIVLKITGMHCGGCAATVTALLEREPGVKSVAVTFESGEAHVLFDPAQVDERRLIEVVRQPGYQAVVQPTA